MILTGNEIQRMREEGSITIEPFAADQINPNSYNYRLGPKLGIPEIGQDGSVTFNMIDIPKDGYVIQPMTTYLGHTHEVLGSDIYAMSLIGRSSLGRLGLFLQVSANLGHTGSCHQWTLEIVSAKSFKLYPYMRIGQISFWENKGEVKSYSDGYSKFNVPQPSRLNIGRVE
jgi:dCTP deaminase